MVQSFASDYPRTPVPSDVVMSAALSAALTSAVDADRRLRLSVRVMGRLGK